MMRGAFRFAAVLAVALNAGGAAVASSEADIRGAVARRRAG